VQPLTPGKAALVLGAVVALLVAVFLVTLARRRVRGFTAFKALDWLMVDAYVLTLWVYAVVPAPLPDTFECRSADFGTLHNLLGMSVQPAGLLANASFQEVVLNTALFIPLGGMVRILFHRGIGVAVGAGLGLSLFSELTQLTGTWGAYSCAYRQFSLEDVLLNTIGALVGSIIGALVLWRPWGSVYAVDVDGASPVSRRVAAVVIDVVALVGICIAAIVFYRLVLTTGIGLDRTYVNAASDTIVGVVVALIVQLVLLVMRGSTLGELALGVRRRLRIGAGEREDEPDPD
jgi:hypothetical protein